ncbi:ABC transporter permease [Limosilactobacillus gastricus]|uniref:ABC transporter permease n=1 Tax=Limosilactobacillus gastricus TaxID=227942 RepID=UPI0026EA2174|nr:ABC transporter permease [Limosilactobacillus gastricus]
MLQEIIQYFQKDQSQYWQLLGQHLALCLITLLVAMVIAFPVGYWASKSRRVATFCTLFAQALRIIPSLGLLFILIPIIGTGELPAIIALVILAIPPILINTIIGLTTVDPIYLEVSRAMGMKNWQILWQVQFPLALPIILNGIKLSLIEVIASATLATYIGAGGLGTLIFTGLGLYEMSYVVIGGFSVALIALLTLLLFDFWIKKVTIHD